MINEESSAFNKALALESIPDEFKNCDQVLLEKYARTIAYKVFHNLKLGYHMSIEDDPLTVDGKKASEFWFNHYEVPGNK